MSMTIQHRRNKLGFSGRVGQKIATIILEQPRVYGVWKGYTRVGERMRYSKEIQNSRLTVQLGAKVVPRMYGPQYE